MGSSSTWSGGEHHLDIQIYFMLTFEAMAGVERNWHITVPGFGSEEYRAYKRPVRFLFPGICI